MRRMSADDEVWVAQALSLLVNSARVSPALREAVATVEAEVNRLGAEAAQARALLDAWCAAAEDGEPLGPLREQTLGWLG